MTRNQVRACMTCDNMGWKQFNVYTDIPLDSIPVPGMIVMEDFQKRLWQIMPAGHLEQVTMEDIEHERRSVLGS